MSKRRHRNRQSSNQSSHNNRFAKQAPPSRAANQGGRVNNLSGPSAMAGASTQPPSGGRSGNNAHAMPGAFNGSRNAVPGGNGGRANSTSTPLNNQPPYGVPPERQTNTYGDQYPGPNANPIGPTQYDNAPRQQPPNFISDVNTDSNWFSPFQPVWPFGPPNVTYPREFDYNVGVNLDYLPRRLQFLAMLRSMAETWGILRAIIENKKDLIVKTPFAFEVQNASNPTNKWTQLLDEFFVKPDGKNHFQTWQRKLLDDMYVIDAATIYNYRSMAGIPYALQVIDGATIRPLVDDAGRIPDSPSPAFQQIIKGLPMINLSEDELIYAPMRPRSYLPVFGYSNVEQFYLEVVQGIRRTMYQTSFWTDGTLPDMVFSVPESWSPAQIAQYQGFFDALLSGNTSLKSNVRFVPGGMKPFFLKGGAAETLKSEWDEWITRLACFVFGVAVTPFIKEGVSRANAEQANEQAKISGETPDLRWFKFNIMDPIVDNFFGFDDIKFVYKIEPDVDPVDQSNVLKVYVQNGILTRNEAREQLGYSPIDGGDEPIIIGPPPSTADPVPAADIAQQQIGIQQQSADNQSRQTDISQQHADTSAQIAQQQPQQTNGQNKPNSKSPNKPKAKPTANSKKPKPKSQAKPNGSNSSHGTGSTAMPVRRVDTLDDDDDNSIEKISHSYSTTQINIPNLVANDIREWISDNVTKGMIATVDDEVRDDCFANDSNLHITLLYGLHTTDPDEVSSVVSDSGAVSIKLGIIDKFVADDYDVLIIRVVRTPQLIDLNQLLSQSLDHSSSYSEYNPHVTLAYIKHGTGDAFIGNEVFNGKEFMARQLVFMPSGDEDSQHVTHLSLIKHPLHKRVDSRLLNLAVEERLIAMAAEAEQRAQRWLKEHGKENSNNI